MTLHPQSVAWSGHFFRHMADEAVWGIPRSGLVFQKQGDSLVLIQEMPYDPVLPISEAELHEYQRAEFEAVKAHFEAAGITVSRAEPAP